MKMKNEINTDAAAGAVAAAASAASAVCIYYVGIGGRFAPPYMYMIKYIQQKQQLQQQQLQQQLQQQHLCLNKIYLTLKFFTCHPFFSLDGMFSLVY